MTDVPGAAFPVVCTGYAITCALGMDTDAVVQSLHAAASGLRPAQLDVPFEATCGALPQPLPAPPVGHDADGRQSRVALHLAAQLEGRIAAAISRWGRDRVAVVVGTSTGGLLDTEHALRDGTGGVLPAGALHRTHAMGATPRVIAARGGITGPAYAISTACSSGAKSLASAARLIRCGAVDAVVAGGIDTLCHLTLRGFHGLGILSAVGCRPFSAERSGISIGEGGALVLLEREGEGIARLVGVGESCDAHQMSAPHPEGVGAEAAMVEALQQAGIAPSQVALINAHGTGTVLNDASEAAAIGRVFGASVPVISTKGYTGHLLGAAGAVEAALCLAALEHGWAPGSLGCDPIDTELPISVQRAQAPLAGRYVLSNSLAFGGSNAAVLWERHP